MLFQNDRVVWFSFFVVLIVFGIIIYNEVTAPGGDDPPDPKQVKLDKKLISEADKKSSIEDVCQIDKKDGFRPELTEPLKKGTIFVSVASYRDDECKDTVYDMFEKASNPDRIFAGVVQQNKEQKEDCFDKCEKCKKRKDSGNIRVKNFPHTMAKGPTFARFEASKLWKNEEYFLEIDSHSKFEQGWDDIAIRQIEQTNDPKAILGGYPPTEKQMKDFKKEGGKRMISMCSGKFNGQGIPELRAKIVKVPKGDQPVKMMFSGANMMMMPAQALLDAPFDPFLSYLFFGEEILHSARLWTHGYNFYAPRQPFMVHHYGRSGKPKFWNDKGSEYKRCQNKAVRRAKYLMGRLPLSDVAVDYRFDVEKYGMGKERRVEEYFEKAGIDWKNRKVNSICSKLGTPVK